MKSNILSLVCLCLPFCFYAQSSELIVDTVGQSSRIQFISPLNNVLIGPNVGNINLTGATNTLIGGFNGTQLTSGFNNVSLGFGAGRDITTGFYNINIGAFAGASHIDGSGNVRIGDGSGGTATTGSFNTMIGDYTGRNSTGSGNLFLGANAGTNFQGDNHLIITNTTAKPPLILGDFANDSLAINGDLYVTGTMEVGTLAVNSIDVSSITGILGNGYSAVFPVVLDNTVSIDIVGIVDGEFLITNTIGIEVDTFTLAGSNGCLDPNVGFTQEYPLTIETDDPADITALDAWFASPSARSISIIIKDLGGSETNRYNLYDYFPSTSSAGSDGRTSYTIVHQFPPNTTLAFEPQNDFGDATSYNHATDKVVQISGITTNSFFSPATTIDYSKRVITLEMTFNEGGAIYDWIKNMADGTTTIKRSMSIITMTSDGQTEVSRQNFFEAVPFQYEITYGFGLNTKLKARIQILYGCFEDA